MQMLAVVHYLVISVTEGNHISSLKKLCRGVGKQMLSPWCSQWGWWFVCQFHVSTQWPCTSCPHGKRVEDAGTGPAAIRLSHFCMANAAFSLYITSWHPIFPLSSEYLDHHCYLGPSDPPSQTLCGSSVPFSKNMWSLPKDGWTDGQTDRTNKELDLCNRTTYTISATQPNNTQLKYPNSDSRFCWTLVAESEDAHDTTAG